MIKTTYLFAAFIFTVSVLIYPAYGEVSKTNITNTENNNNFRIVFNFPEPGEKDIDRVNEVLSHLPLSNLEIESGSNGYDGYLVTLKKYDNNHELAGLTYNYGFYSLTLLCTVNARENAHYYQIETQAIPKDVMKNPDKFDELWKKEHPDRIIRVLSTISFDSSDVWAFVILHHEKAEHGK